MLTKYQKEESDCWKKIRINLNIAKVPPLIQLLFSLLMALFIPSLFFIWIKKSNETNNALS